MSTLVMMAAILSGNSDIRRDETVIFYPTYAHPSKDGKSWRVRLHGIIYELEEGSKKCSVLLSAIRKSVKIEKNSPEAKTFEQRTRLFLVDNEGGKEIAVQLGRHRVKCARSGSNGHFAGHAILNRDEMRELLKTNGDSRQWVEFVAETNPGDARRIIGRVQVIPAGGVSVISDFDDTIKITNVRNRKELLANTFTRDFQAAPGMKKLYRALEDRGARFHYVSGSPWQLYPVIAKFLRDTPFPQGSLHLKSVRLKDSSFQNLFAKQRENKMKAIEQILNDFPERTFLLFGDSGEEDPEIYGEIARKHPDRIVGVFIRNVTEQSREDSRYTSVFEDLNASLWFVFDDPQDVQKAVLELVK